MAAEDAAKKAMERSGKALQKRRSRRLRKNLQAAVEIYPAYATAWFTLGRIYQQQRRAEDARLAFSKAVEADANYVLPYVELARLAALERKWEEVADLTDRAIALNPLDIPEPVPSLEKLEDIVIRMVGAEVDSIASRLFH
jgi:tetratricopeptide (TPR) repeat protein